MLPIVREGINSQHANPTDIVHNTFNLTGFSIDKLRSQNHLNGNDQIIEKKKLILPSDTKVTKQVRVGQSQRDKEVNQTNEMQVRFEEQLNIVAQHLADEYTRKQ